MEAPSADRLLAAWESAAAALPVWRPVSLLASASSHAASDVAQWPIGRRDAAIMGLQRQWFGDAMECLADCPACGNTAEFSTRVSDLCSGDTDVQDGTHAFEHDGWRVQFRLPCSQDLANAAAHAVDTETARARLLNALCSGILDAAGHAQTPDDLPASVVAELEQRIAGADPLSEITFELACPACGHVCNAPWDPSDHFWRQLDRAANALLREVHLLARSHGWREAEILALSPTRRRAYLDLLVP
jgi:hypothetical protein